MIEELEEKTSVTQRLKTALVSVVILGFLIVAVVMVRGQDQLVVRDPGAYNAVFLDNDQVYFGKLKVVDEDFWSLTDIYYLRAGTLQEGEIGAQIDLIKLGAELHAPRDEMIINNEHIIFYEEIGRESEIAKLIEQHKAQK